MRNQSKCHGFIYYTCRTLSMGFTAFHVEPRMSMTTVKQRSLTSSLWKKTNRKCGKSDDFKIQIIFFRNR